MNDKEVFVIFTSKGERSRGWGVGSSHNGQGEGEFVGEEKTEG